MLCPSRVKYTEDTHINIHNPKSNLNENKPQTLCSLWQLPAFARLLVKELETYKHLGILWDCL